MDDEQARQGGRHTKGKAGSGKSALPQATTNLNHP